MLPVVKIQLDKERLMKFGSMAYINMEKAMGMSISKIDFESVEATYAMLYACLKGFNHDLTLNDLYMIVDDMTSKKMEEGKNFGEAFQEVMEYIGSKIAEVTGDKADASALPSE